MRVLALTLSFIGLIGALPKSLFYSPSKSYSIKPFVYFGRGYGHTGGHAGGHTGGHTGGYVGGRFRGHVGGHADSHAGGHVGGQNDRHGGGHFGGYRTNYNSLNFIRGSEQFGGRFGGFQNPLTFIRGSGDTTSVGGLFTDATSAAEAVKNTLVQLAANPDTAVIVNKVLASDDSCGVKNVDEGVERIEEAIGALDGIKGDVEALYISVKAFIPLKDPVKVLRKTSELVKLLQPLNNKANDDFELDILRCVTNTLSSTNQLHPITAAKLSEASGIISAVTSFMDGLRRTTARLENACTDGKLNADFILAIGDLIDDIADLYVAVGDAQAGERIRQGTEIVGRFTVRLVIIIIIL